MFKKLKKRLLIINMISISLLMIIAFLSIFFFTYSRTTGEIENSLNRLVAFRPGGEIPPGQEENKTDLPEREVSFVISLNENNIILSSHASFDVETGFYKQALALTETNEKDDYIELEDEKWAFKIVEENKIKRIIFVNVTTQLNSIVKLAYTFAVVFLVMFVLNYFFSNYMTRESIKPIKKAFEKQNQFISDASHELKTPLAVISSNVDVLLEGAENSQKWLNYIKLEVVRMKNLTENLLYLSQFDDSSISVNHKKINMSQLCEHILLGMETVAFEKKRHLKYKIQPDIFINGNPEQLSQVLLILVDNAIKYSKENGLIDVHLEKNNHLELSVTNEGPGIAEKDLDKIFNRFYKVDQSRSQITGYGLGLSIADSIVSDHQGKINCTSVLNKKTTFSVILPN